MLWRIVLSNLSILCQTSGVHSVLYIDTLDIDHIQILYPIYIKQNVTDCVFYTSYLWRDR